jgi:hypothetical protein
MRRWLLASLLFIASAVAIYYALFNAWAAGGPPTQFSEVYRARYRAFEIVAFICFIGAFIVIFWRKKGSSGE